MHFLAFCMIIKCIRCIEDFIILLIDSIVPSVVYMDNYCIKMQTLRIHDKYSQAIKEASYSKVPEVI